MKATKWREMQNDELEQKVRDLTEELFNLRLQLAMGVAKNPARVGQARRELARAKTVLRERELNIVRRPREQLHVRQRERERWSSATR
jgi:large subunit ribosomal protein L29